MKKKCLSIVFIVCVLVVGAGDVFSSMVTVDFSGFHNNRLQGDGQGGKGNSEYPEGQLSLGGVPFDIPAGGLNYWTPESGINQIDVHVAIDGVDKIHTLINSLWGQDWSAGSFASIEFFGSGGAYFKKDLFGNKDIRDWLWGYWTTSINDTSTVNVFTSSGGFNYQARLDMQNIDLPDIFLTEQLQTIRFSDNGGANFQRMLVYGITAETIPEPISIGLFALGGVVLIGKGKKK